jgi:hypothetical protein
MWAQGIAETNTLPHPSESLHIACSAKSGCLRELREPMSRRQLTATCIVGFIDPVCTWPPPRPAVTVSAHGLGPGPRHGPLSRSRPRPPPRPAVTVSASDSLTVSDADSESDSDSEKRKSLAGSSPFLTLVVGLIVLLPNDGHRSGAALQGPVSKAGRTVLASTHAYKNRLSAGARRPRYALVLAGPLLRFLRLR